MKIFRKDQINRMIKQILLQNKETKEKTKHLIAIGNQIRKNNQVAILTLAGGVGSRLGCDGPKGIFEIQTKNSSLSLYERQAKKIGSLTWIIMVSSRTREQTIKHLQERIIKEKEIIYLIDQDDIEALSLDHYPLYLDDHPVLVPNGNGSVFKALQKSRYTQITKNDIVEVPSSILDYLQTRNILYLNIVSIDNVLVRIADPLVLGYLSENKLEVVSAAVPIPEGTQMGVFTESNGKIQIQEYTDKPTTTVIKNTNERILGNIANHTATLTFLQAINPESLKYHEAIKKIPHSKDLSPSKPNAIKRELFIFDGFNLAHSHGIVEYDHTSYEGLKTKEGPRDSLTSCINALNQMHQ
ncbi:UDP-N-acetylglucosamine/UDP-N-acetylgalactosamine diphosphorylase [Nematocida sp. AWRm80]|nr:UDP-N-acetylglucosamine/UDP-N-acetylgalactosamine diphosphorylase [Nematocida sp. AWRm80]